MSFHNQQTQQTAPNASPPPTVVLGLPPEAFTPLLTVFDLPTITLVLPPMVVKPSKLDTLPPNKPSNLADVDEAILKGQWEVVQAIYRGGKRGDGSFASGQDKAKIRDAIIGSQQGWQALGALPELAGEILSALDPATLKDFDLDEMLGNKKNDAVGAALLRISGKVKAPGGVASNRDN